MGALTCMVAASNGEGVKANLTTASTAGNGRRGRRGEEEDELEGWGMLVSEKGSEGEGLPVSVYAGARLCVENVSLGSVGGLELGLDWAGRLGCC